MSDEVAYCLQWYAGAAAQLEIFDPGTAGSGYRLKYVPPMRATIRPPVENLPLGGDQLGPVNRALDDLGKTLLTTRDALAGAAAGGVITAQQLPAAKASFLANMEELGGTLLDLIVPHYIQSDLRSAGLFLEMGMDETLLSYPWELMHDGDDFLCLKHAMARFINGSQFIPMNTSRYADWKAEGGPLSVLLISLSKSIKHGDFVYERLDAAAEESSAIITTLTDLGVDVTLLADENATLSKVRGELGSGRHQIIHFCGHASFNDANPPLSSLVLFDQAMTTGAVVRFISKNRPVLCFVNACETAKALSGRELFNVYGLARAFLETGAYLIGSRWKVSDAAAAKFASTFYGTFIGDGKPLGEAVKQARQVCKRDWPDDPAWASYILYGDPRICFRKVAQKD